jgi:Mn-dependent DtxR family transcriptional regulator
MSQYEVAKLLHERAQPQSKEQLAREIGVQPATVGDTLRKLRRKEYAERIGPNQFEFHPDCDETDLKKLEPMVIKGDF